MSNDRLARDAKNFALMGDLVLSGVSIDIPAFCASIREIQRTVSENILALPRDEEMISTKFGDALRGDTDAAMAFARLLNGDMTIGMTCMKNGEFHIGMCENLTGLTSSSIDGDETNAIISAGLRLLAERTELALRQIERPLDIKDNGPEPGF